MVVRADLVDTADPVFLIALTDITVPADRLRSLKRAGVSAFMFALDADGQYEPIAVAQLPGRSDFTLVDGYHRLEAVRRLGWASIKACIVGIGSDERRRREILSEVVRVKSDVFDRAAQIKALADMARADATLSHPVGPFDDVASTMIVLALEWDEQTAHTLGISRQTVYNHLKIARTFDADWISRLRKLGMAFDLVPLLALAKLEPRIITKAIGWLERRVDDDGRTTSTIVEAIAAVLGNAAPTAADKRFNAVIGNLGRMAEAERSAVVGRIVAQYLTDADLEAIIAQRRGTHA